MKLFFIKPIILALLLTLSSSITGLAREPGAFQTVQIFFENDLFGNTDRYYTNALQVTWLSKDLKRYRDDVRLPDWSVPIVKKVPFANVPNSIHNVGLLLGQQIYTPANIHSADLQTDDRPYAGYLYAGIALHSKTPEKLDTMEITLGVVGPASLARQSQNKVHDLRNIDQANGWHNQLHNEPALRFAWQRKWRTFRTEVTQLLTGDLITYTGVVAGNVETSANTGAEFRLGYNIPWDFGSDVIRPGAGVSAPISNRSTPGNGGFGIHLFAGVRTDAVLHNIFLDGNTYQSSHNVDKKPFKAEGSVGIAVSFDTLKLTYRHVFRTKEFDGQHEGHVLGSLALTYAF